MLKFKHKIIKHNHHKEHLIPKTGQAASSVLGYTKCSQQKWALQYYFKYLLSSYVALCEYLLTLITISICENQIYNLHKTVPCTHYNIPLQCLYIWLYYVLFSCIWALKGSFCTCQDTIPTGINSALSPHPPSLLIHVEFSYNHDTTCFKPEDGHSMFLQNADIQLIYYWCHNPQYCNKNVHCWEHLSSCTGWVRHHHTRRNVIACVSHTKNTTKFPRCSSHIDSTFNTTTKLSLYTVVCAVLCCVNSTWFWVRYCVGVQWLLAHPILLCTGHS